MMRVRYDGIPSSLIDGGELFELEVLSHEAGFMASCERMRRREEAGGPV